MDSVNVENERSYFILGGSVVGPSHVQRSVPCQDAAAFEVLPFGLAVLAVADGAGSAQCSDIGAQTAVKAVVDNLASEMSQASMSEANLHAVVSVLAGRARSAVEQKSQELGCALRDLASTLVVAILREDSIVVAHIGDGGVVIKTAGGLNVISPPEESEYANETTFLTGENWQKSLRLSSLASGVQGAAVFTDGCQRAALLREGDGWIAGERFLGELFSYADEIADPQEGTQDLMGLLRSAKVCENCDDDKTLLLAVRKLRAL